MKIVIKSVLILFLSISYSYGQCPFGGTNSGTIVTPTSADQFTGNLRGGRYFTMNVTANGFYTVSTIGLAGWDTQLTIHDTSGNFIAYNDDFGGTTQSEISFISPITGQVRVLLNQFNCATTNGGTTTQVRYRGSTSYLTINNITVAEEDGTAIFTVTYNGTSTGAFTVDYATADGTARNGGDYISTTGSLSFSGAAGQTRTVTVNLVDNTFGESNEEFFLNLSNATNSVDIASFGTAIITDGDPAIPQDVPLTLYDDLNGNYDYTVAGGTFRTQSNGVDPCAITTTSSGQVTSTIPTGAVVKKAYLYWSHSNSNPDNIVTFEGQSVEADVIYGASFFNASLGSDVQFYGYISDVTDAFDLITNPTTNLYDVTDLDIDNGGDYCASATVLGAWSLMIFYEDLALPASTLNLYYGFDVTSNAGTTFTLDNFYAIGASGSKATFLSYEGDATLDGSSVGSTNPEELSITSQSGVTTILSGDGGQTGNNAYNSTIYDGLSGVNNIDIHGLDLDTYNISPYISIADTQVTANVDVGQDLVISSAVLIKVPSNLISGTVFEDVNYPGGDGRNNLVSSGVGIAGVTVELYDSLGSLVDTAVSNTVGDYAFGGMADGTYSIRVVSGSVKSSRCTSFLCDSYPVQTFRAAYNGTSLAEVVNEVGGANPAATADAAAGTLTNAQSISQVVIASAGVGNIDFGFNFNTIVNTNASGQGSLDRFIINSNNLDETGLDIEANSIFDPAPGEDTSIFMIPPTADPQGRTADANFNGTYFDIALINSLTTITSNNTHIDGRTQTAYATDTNTGTIGAGGTTVGTSAIVLPNYDRPEIQVHTTAGDVFIVEADNTVIRNLAIYATNNAAILQNSGSLLITQNIVGLDAIVSNVGIVINNGTAVIDGNYMRSVVNFAIGISGGTSTLIQNNHFFENAVGPCSDTITLNGGTGIVIQNNLIANTGGIGIDGWNYTSPVTISENTIENSGQNGGDCSGSIENAGVRLYTSNSVISKNSIRNNGGPGLVITGGTTTGNLITQNSFYGNGTTSPALGIDIDVATTGNPVGDGITLNDNGDADTGPNGVVNFPVFNGLPLMDGTDLVIRGWARPGAIIEFFLTDISEGSATMGDNQLGQSQDYGEGQTYLTTLVEGGGSDLSGATSSYTDADGNTDNTNEFEFRIPMPAGVNLYNTLTATATIGNSTSEFSSAALVDLDTDADGVADSVDLDDDNDGILDSIENECQSSSSAVFSSTTNLWQSADMTVAAGLSYELVPTGSTFGSYTANGGPHDGKQFYGVSIGFGQIWDYDGNRYTNGGAGIADFFSVAVTSGPNMPTANLLSSDYNAFPIFVGFIDTNYNGQFDRAAGDVVISTIFSMNGPLAWVAPVSGDLYLVYTDSNHTDNAGELSALVNCTLLDTDLDGIPNYLDADSDGDGCNDADEGYADQDADLDNNNFFGSGVPSVNPDGTVIGASYAVPADGDANGIYDFLEIGTAATITTEPTDQTVFVNNTATFSVIVTNGGSYQWEESIDGGLVFTPITDTAKYSGSQTASLLINSATIADSGNLYRVTVANTAFICDTGSISQQALLQVKVRTVITNRRITHRVKKNN